MHKRIQTNDAPAAVGPYSQAIVAEGKSLIFISGQIPLDPVSMKIETTDVALQTKVVLKNLSSLLKASGVGPEHVVKTTIFIKDMNDYAAINAEYERFFSEHKPARACVEVARLPKDALVEIEAIAVK